MSYDVEHYIELLPNLSQSQPKFTAVLTTLVGAFVAQQALVEAIPQLYDVDSAVGAQLDVLGEWVGIRRILPVPITGVYFAWDDVDPAVGWEAGVWQGVFDPDAGPTTLNDDDYRRLIKTKILINRWDGSYVALLDIWNELLPADRLGIVIDNQDMTMAMGYEGATLSGLELSVLLLGLGFLKPAAVRISDVFSSTSGEPVFSWDSDGRGWEEASWSTLINV